MTVSWYLIVIKKDSSCSIPTCTCVRWLHRIRWHRPDSFLLCAVCNLPGCSWDKRLRYTVAVYSEPAHVQEPAFESKNNHLSRLDIIVWLSVALVLVASFWTRTPLASDKQIAHRMKGVDVMVSEIRDLPSLWKGVGSSRMCLQTKQQTCKIMSADHLRKLSSIQQATLLKDEHGWHFCGMMHSCNDASTQASDSNWCFPIAYLTSALDNTGPPGPKHWDKGSLFFLSLICKC